MLGTVRVKGTLTREGIGLILPLLAHNAMLLAFELVQQNLVESFVEVLLDARYHFVKDILVGRRWPVGPFLVGVFVYDLVYRIF